MSSSFKREPLTTIQLEKAIIESRGKITFAAAALSVSANAIRKRIKGHARLHRALLEARENRVDRAESVIDNLLEMNHFGAAKLTLERQGKDRGWADDGPRSLSIAFNVERIDEPRDTDGNVLELPSDIE